MTTWFRIALFAACCLGSAASPAQPEKTVLPPSLLFEVIEGQLQSQPLLLGNSGSSDLDWLLEIGASAATASPPSNAFLTQGFESVSGLSAAGWGLFNNSEPLGTTTWFQGSGSIFPAHEGPTNSYITAAYHSTANQGTISTWLITPELTLYNGTRMSFWTRTTTGASRADRLEVRLSTAGASLDIGDSAQSVGDFDQRLLSINENLLANGYPREWTRFEVTVSGLDVPTTGRFALRYYITDGGIGGSHSNWIGIDSLSVQPPCTDNTDIDWLAIQPGAGLLGAGQEQPISIAADAEALAPGDYDTLLCLSSNDPDHPLFPIPVQLEVIAADARLAVDPQQLLLELDIAETRTETITLSNPGNIDLDWALVQDSAARDGDLEHELLFEDFSGTFPPPLWSLVDQGVQPCPWKRSDGYNLSGWSGSGLQAAVDSDQCLSGNSPAETINSSLDSPAINVIGYRDLRVEFDLAFRHLNASRLELKVSTDQGQHWQTLQTWTGSVGHPGSTLQPQSVSLADHDGAQSLMLRWRYLAGWDWWVIVDNIRVIGTPDLPCYDPAVDGWVQTQTESGLLAPGQTQTLELTIDSETLSAGTHGLALCFGSNAATEPLPRLPILVEILDLPSPVLAFQPDQLDLGNVEVGSSASATVVLANQGNATANELVFITDALDRFQVDTSACPASLAPGEQCQLLIDFLASAEEEIAEQLQAGADDADTATLPMVARGVTIPVIDVQPDSIDVAVFSGQIETRQLLIGNTGTGSLDWSLSSAQADADDKTGNDNQAPASAGRSLVGDWQEGFNNVSQLPQSGWVLNNRSEPLGSSGWDNGTVFLPPHQGPPGAYAGASAQSTTGGNGLISNWLITPETQLFNGTLLSFWTRTAPGSNYPDRLEVRLSTAGASAEVGNSATSVGDFSTLLLSINEALEQGGYPSSWTRFELELSGLPAPTTGRFGFRYFVDQAGPSGVNSLFVGIDTLSVTQPGNCALPETFDWLTIGQTSGSTAAGQTSAVEIEIDASALAPGTHGAQLCVFSNDAANSLVVVPVTVTVAPPPAPALAFNVPAVNLGAVVVGATSAPMSVELINSGTAAATGLNLIPPGGGFEASLDNCGGALAAGASCPIEVRFTPTQVGPVSRLLGVEDSSGQLVTVQLLATGLPEPVDEVFRDRFQSPPD